MENDLGLRVKPKQKIIKLVTQEELDKLRLEYSNINKGCK